MCTYCGQHCVEDEPFRLSLKELKSGKRLPENTCPDKQKDDDVISPNDPGDEHIEEEA